MKKFATITEKVIPLNINNVDTDAIIPAQYLTSTSKHGYAKNLFAHLKSQSKDFPFNQSQYQGAKILLAGRNFGCGSSREHAVWALMEWGIEVILAPYFSDIFQNNAGKNGLLLISLGDDLFDHLLLKCQNQVSSLTVDLKKQIILDADKNEISFTYDAFQKHCLLEGIDELDYILSKEEEIKTFKHKNSFFRGTKP